MSPTGRLSGLVAGTTPELAAGPTVAVGKDHAVYVFWWANVSGQSAIVFVKSTNGWDTFTTPAIVTMLSGSPSNGGDLGLNFSTNSFPQVAVSPTSGLLVVTFNDTTGDPAEGADVFVTTSSDGGANWDSAGSLTPGKDQFGPSCAFTPDRKHLLFTWYDRRTDPANALIERWGMIVTFSDPANPSADLANLSLSPQFRIHQGAGPLPSGRTHSSAPRTWVFMTRWRPTTISSMRSGATIHWPTARTRISPMSGLRAFR